MAWLLSWHLSSEWQPGCWCVLAVPHAVYGEVTLEGFHLSVLIFVFSTTTFLKPLLLLNLCGVSVRTLSYLEIYSNVNMKLSSEINTIQTHER